jgi:hypothetical protein
MGKRISKSETYRYVHAINCEVERLVWKRKNIRHLTGNSYRQDGKGITKFLYKIAGTELPKRYKDYYSNSLFDQYVEKKYAARKAAQKSNDYINKWSLRHEYEKKLNVKLKEIDETIRKLENHRGKLLSSWYAAKGRKNKRLMGKSVAELVGEGSELPIEGLTFCSKSGREVEVSFKMFRNVKKQHTSRYYRNSWYNTVEDKTPETFYDIGILKLDGYVFDSNFKKMEVGNRDVYSPNAQTKNGVLKASTKAGASAEITEAAKKLREAMGNSIFCTYIDSKSRGSFKIKDIYILNAAPKVNKQWERGVFRGKDREYKRQKYQRYVNEQLEALAKWSKGNEENK